MKPQRAVRQNSAADRTADKSRERLRKAFGCRTYCRMLEFQHGLSVYGRRFGRSERPAFGGRLVAREDAPHSAQPIAPRLRSRRMFKAL